MTITLNGDARDVPVGTTVAELVRLLNLTPEKVAVERNRRLVRREGYDLPLADGDQVEVVTFVGGGAG
jgi:thiamine biosynthesis protein ThiS